MFVPKPPTPAFAISRWIFARALGAIFFCAFGSLALQVRGLLGAHGIAPAHEFLENVRQHFGGPALWDVPTLFWINDSDAMLLAVCAAGLALAVLLACGWRPGLC